MKLFDDLKRNYTGYSGYTEPDFAYYNRSARPEIAKVREVLEAWFSRYPLKGKREFRQRFRSRNDWQHRSAFFELFLHELMLLLSCSVRVHPGRGQRESRKPDFRAETLNGNRFYVEAVVANEESRAEMAARARMNRMYDALGRMQSPDFFLYMKIKGSSRTSPPAARIRSSLVGHLRDLDLGEIAKLWRSGKQSSLPHWSYRHEGMEVIFFPIPKGPKTRGKPGVRPIGIQFHEIRVVRTADAVRRAVLKKAGRYGELRLPYVIALNALCDTVDKTDVEEALLGTERMTIPYGLRRSTEQVWTRAPDGALTGGSGRRYTRVSGVLVVSKLKPWNIPGAKIQLYHNPSARTKCPEVLTCLPQAFAPDGANVRYEKGESLAGLFGLPMGWPER